MMNRDMGDRLGGPGRRLLPRVVPRRAGAGVGRDVLGGCSGQVQQGEEAADRAVLASDHEEALGLPLPPPRRDRCRRLALPGQDQVQDRLPVARPRRLGILLAPGVPVDRRHDAGKAAEHVLGVGDRALLLVAPRRPQATVDVAADRHGTPAGSRRGRASADRPPGRRGPDRAGTHPSGPDSTNDSPRSQVNGSCASSHLEHLPQQRLGGHPGDRAHLEGAAVEPAGDDLDEPSQQRAHQIRASAGRPPPRRRERPRRPTATAPAGGRAPARPAGRGGRGRRHRRDRYCRLSSGLRLRSDTTRNSSRQAGSARQAGPRCCPSGDHREGGGRQTRQQSSAHPVIQRRQPLIGVEQNHHPATVGRLSAMAPSPSGTVEHLAQRLEHGRAATGRDRARQGEPRSHRHRWRAPRNVQQARLADAWWSVDVEHHERRFRRRRARPGTARPRTRGRRIVAAGRDANRSPSVPPDCVPVIPAG